MKNKKAIYWTASILFSAFMAFTAVPDILMSKDAVVMIIGLGYPEYFIPFIGVAKLLGAIAILVPGYPRIKEWAYAGLTFDLIAALYSILMKEGFKPQLTFFILPFGLMFISYYLWHKQIVRSNDLADMKY